MTLPLALFLHITAAVTWVGGMIFVYVCLRPSLGQLDESDRLNIWQDVLSRFFKIVWVAIFVLLISGHWMIYYYGGFVAIGRYIPAMTLVAYLMFGLFGHVYYALFKPFATAVKEQDKTTANQKLSKMRVIMAINIVLGVSVLWLGVAGKYVLG